jgi:hypothetical protein
MQEERKPIRSGTYLYSAKIIPDCFIWIISDSNTVNTKTDLSRENVIIGFAESVPHIEYIFLQFFYAQIFHFRIQSISVYTQ